ncbi:unnamed protein product [Scytosiphon promiscuus]
MGKAVALSWIQSIGSDTTGDFARARGWLVDRLNAFGSSRMRATSSPSRTGISQWQTGCPEIIPGLRSKAFWSAEEFKEPWVAELEEGFRDAREELLTLRGRGGFQPYRAPRGRSIGRGALAAKDGVGSHCHKGGDWNVFYLFLHDAVDFSKNRSMCPKTVSLVEALPRHYKHAFLSALAPGTHVVKHNGPTNKKLRVHLPLVAPCGGLSRLRVGSETREVAAGQALVFDDSFEHEAWNDHSDADNSTDTDSNTGNAAEEPRCYRGVPTDAQGERGSSCRNRRPFRREGQGGRCCTPDQKKGGASDGRSGPRRAATRVTLIADVWHPDLSDREVRFFSFLQVATLRLENRLVEGARKKSSGSLQGARGHRGIATAGENHDSTKATSDATDRQFSLAAPPTTAAKIPQRERHNNDKEKRSASASRRYSHGGRGAAAEKPKLTMTPKITSTARIISPAAGRQRMPNEPPDDPGEGGGRFRNVISDGWAEGSSEEPARGMAVVGWGGGGGDDAACDAGDTAGVGVDNFLEVIKCARAIRSTESNIFGP